VVEHLAGGVDVLRDGLSLVAGLLLEEEERVVEDG